MTGEAQPVPPVRETETVTASAPGRRGRRPGRRPTPRRRSRRRIARSGHHSRRSDRGARRAASSRERTMTSPSRARPCRIRDALPHALVPQPRGEVPAVAEPRRVDAHPLRPADLRLGVGRGMHAQRELVPSRRPCAALSGSRAVRYRPLTEPSSSPSQYTSAPGSTPSSSRTPRHVRRRLRRVDRAAVHPRSFRHPLAGTAVASDPRVGHLPRPVQVVDHRSRNARRAASREPPRSLPTPPPRCCPPRAAAPRDTTRRCRRVPRGWSSRRRRG